MLSKVERDKYWTNGQGYNRYITEELNSFRGQAWKHTLCRHFKEGAVLDILDIGTGPGFFACILSQEGHRVTGIDNSDGMLAYARQNAERLKVAPEFLKMDINRLIFEDDSFDIIVARNVTWTLETPEKVYTELKRILRPHGQLLIYDANWHMHYFDQELMKRVRTREQRHFEKYGKRELVCADNLEYFGDLPLSNTVRPQWDVTVLSRLGFHVSTEEDIGRTVYEEWEKELYGESPLFEVCAVKSEMTEEQARVRNYWQKRSATFGFSLEGDSLKTWCNRIQKYLPKGPLKVLDAGTGPGFMAAVMATLGHEVTGIDLCSRMIERARENAKTSGLRIDFFCTDAGELPFDDGAFDVVISRNVIWALTNPEEALCQWRRVLKSGGLLIYFDGNHYYYLFNDEARKARELYTALTGSPYRDDTGTVDYSEMEKAALELPLSKFDRPHGWDERVLPQLGYEIVAEETEHPQDFLKDGVPEGYYTSFMMIAKKLPDGGR